MIRDDLRISFRAASRGVGSRGCSVSWTKGKVSQVGSGVGYGPSFATFLLGYVD